MGTRQVEIDCFGDFKSKYDIKTTARTLKGKEFEQAKKDYLDSQKAKPKSTFKTVAEMRKLLKRSA